MVTSDEILETIKMVKVEQLDIRTVTLGINLLDCAKNDVGHTCERITDKVMDKAGDFVEIVNGVQDDFGIPIVNKRISVTPISLLINALGMPSKKAAVKIATTLDEAAEDLGINFIGGYTALVHRGASLGDNMLIESIPEAMEATERLCSSVVVASTRDGINMDEILRMGRIIKKTSEISDTGCARLVVLANAPEDIPFMPGAYHGIGNSDASINVGISGPGVVRAAVEKTDGNFMELCDTIKRVSFKIVRAGELIGEEVAKRMKVDFGSIDLSLAPTPAVGDSVAKIIEDMGIEHCGGPGSTCALALLTDAVKKGGIMASSRIGGYSGAFIPVSEDRGMIEVAKAGYINIEKLEAMTSVCSVGLDMVPIPGDTPAEIIAGIIADQMAIGVYNNKTVGARLVPIKGKKEGDYVHFGGLLGEGSVMHVKNIDCSKFVKRGGRIPASVTSFRN